MGAYLVFYKKLQVTFIYKKYADSLTYTYTFVNFQLKCLLQDAQVFKKVLNLH